MTEKTQAPIISVNNEKANLLEVCCSLESCRKAIISYKSSTSYWLTVEHTIDSLDNAIFDVASILADDDPDTIISIMEEIGHKDNNCLDGEL